MKTVQAYRLGYDDNVTFILPAKREAIRQSEATWGKVFDLTERREIMGGIPQPWPKTEQ